MENDNLKLYKIKFECLARLESLGITDKSKILYDLEGHFTFNNV